MSHARRRTRQFAVWMVGIVSVGMGWALLWHLLTPRTLAGVSTGELFVVLGLLLLPAVGWVLWRWEGSLRSLGQPGRAPVGSVRLQPEPGDRV